ncbi:hypothetical protein [Flocculibacter collagenilyticus]|uniref:hypothetical protein n=1 Tax=Flocculibacter collagenilyticus TaxID=2744479 RepID=UPI0018F51899|nr:hypothetical protein [Flocculibacter collagenilyticus]
MALNTLSLKAKNGGLWIKHAWEILKIKPASFIAISIFTSSLFIAGQLHPILGLLIMFANPFITAAYYVVIEHARQGHHIRFEQFFSAIKHLPNKLTLFRLAVVSLLLSALFSIALSPILETLQQGAKPDFGQIVLVVVVSAIYMMLFAYAVPIAVFTKEKSLPEIFKGSFFACWRNVIPLTVYSIISMLLIALTIPTLMVGMIIVIPVLTISFYLSFINIFAPSLIVQQSENSDEDDSNNGNDGMFLG